MVEQRELGNGVAENLTDQRCGGSMASCVCLGNAEGLLFLAINASREFMIIVCGGLFVWLLC